MLRIDGPKVFTFLFYGEYRTGLARRAMPTAQKKVRRG